jgi:predicted amidohydrolase
VVEPVSEPVAEPVVEPVVEPVESTPPPMIGRRLRLLLTALNCPKGDIDANLERARELLGQGRESGCDLVLLPEMSLTGYRPSAAIGLSHPAVADLVASTDRGPAICFGLVEESASGQAPYITQVIAAGGEVTAVHRKAGLGDGEGADFVAGAPTGVAVVSGVPVSVAVCAEIGLAAQYELESAVVLAPSAPGLYGERRSSDADWRRGFEWWRGSVLADAERLLRPGQWLAVSTQAGATDDEDFPGWAALVGAAGTVAAELPDWREGALVVDVAARGDSDLRP